MKIIRFNDGEILEAASPTELVSLMRDSSRFLRDQNVLTYMSGFAERYLIDTGNSVRHDTEDNFVADLMNFGFILDVKDKEEFNGDFS